MLRSLCFAALAGLIFVSRPVAAQAPEGTYRFEPRPYSADMTVGELLENPSTRAVVLARIPAFASLPIDAVARRPLRAVRPLAPQVVSAEALARVDADLRKLPPSAEAVQAARRAESEAAAAVLDPAQPWITAREALMADYERRPITLQFRRELELPAKLRKLEVQVSADNRFVLYVNGQRVAAGPSRGDLLHWRYTMIDLAPYLRAGRNIIAAEVWNEGEFAPLAQVSAGHTGFMLRAVDEGFRTIDTGPSWRVRLDRSRSVANGLMQVAGAVGRTYYVAGAPETLDGRAVVANWMAATTTVNGWVAPVAAVTKGEKQRRLVADTLPPMRYKLIPSGKVVRSSRADLAAFPARRVTVPANTEATLLIDAGRVLAAYPVLRTSAGAAATVSLTYTEALYDPARKPGGASPGKGAWPRFADRSTVADGLALGLTDNFQLAGGAERFAPLWWRAWRFVEVKVKTGAEPVVLEALETYETGYPFQQRGYFRSNDPELNKVWEIGWRTGLVDAHETYQDTAYWELSDDRVVTAWIALTDSNTGNGCVRVVAGSHRTGMLAHDLARDRYNRLLRGQIAAVSVAAERVVPLELRAGQMSLHHGRLLHSSPGNPSDAMRVGLAVRYVSPDVRPGGPRQGATLVRGIDRFGHFDHEPVPRYDFDPFARAWHGRAMRRYAVHVLWQIARHPSRANLAVLARVATRRDVLRAMR